MKPVFKIVAIGAVVGGAIYLASRGLKLKETAENLSYVVKTKAWDFRKDSKKITFKVDITLINPSATQGLTIDRPEIIVFYKGSNIGNSKPKLERTVLKPKDSAQINDIEITFDGLSILKDFVNFDISQIFSINYWKDTVNRFKNALPEVKKNTMVRVLTNVNGVPINYDYSLNSDESVQGVTAVERSIRYTTKYDSFFDKPYLNEVVYKKGGTRDTALAICDIIRKDYKQTKRIADHLKADTLQNTCNNIWDFCYHHLKYQVDDGEELRSPRRAFYDGQVLARQYPKVKNKLGKQSGIDCDCFTIFCGSILKNLNIPFYVKVSAYRDALGFLGNYQHVYVIVPIPKGYLTIDPVMDAFNKEKTVGKSMIFDLNKNEIKL